MTRYTINIENIEIVATDDTDALEKARVLADMLNGDVEFIWQEDDNKGVDVPSDERSRVRWRR